MFLEPKIKVCDEHDKIEYLCHCEQLIELGFRFLVLYVSVMLASSIQVVALGFEPFHQLQEKFTF